MTLSILLALCIIYIIAKHLKQYRIAKALKAKRMKRQKYIKNELIPYFIHQLELATSLDEIFLLHIKIWANGIRNRNIGPDQYGMFRTDNILLMTKGEVYLGGLCGLNTHNILFWEQHPEPIAISQYKIHLINNLKLIQNDTTTTNSNL